MLKKLMHMTAAIALLGGVAMQSATPADAHSGRTAGVVAGTIIGLGILGAAAASRDRDYYYRDTCYEGPRRCEVVGERCFYDRYGEYRCKDDVRCWRPRRCD